MVFEFCRKMANEAVKWERRRGNEKMALVRDRLIARSTSSVSSDELWAAVMVLVGSSAENAGETQSSRVQTRVQQDGSYSYNIRQELESVSTSPSNIHDAPSSLGRPYCTDTVSLTYFLHGEQQPADQGYAEDFTRQFVTRIDCTVRKDEIAKRPHNYKHDKASKWLEQCY